MRIWILMIAMCWGGFCAEANNPALINERFENLQLKRVFKQLKQKYGLKIAFSDRLVADKKITVDIREKSVIDAFEILLEGTGLTYEYIAPKAIIIKRGRTEDKSFDLIGEIYDRGTGERLPFALIKVAGLSGGTTSNEDGIFSLKGLSDTSRIEISYLGYQTVNHTISRVDRKSRLFIAMRSSVESLEEVTVAAMQSKIEVLDDLSRVAFDPGLVENIPTTAEKDVFRMMQLIPGVTATNELQSGLEVNGGNVNQNVITFDGFRVYHMDHFFGYFSAINPYSVKSMRLFKTGFNAKYGGSASSVMELTGKDGNNSQVSGRFSINPLSINTSLEAPISDNTTLFMSGRRSYSDLFNLWHFNRIFEQYGQQVQGSEEILTLVDSIEYEPEFIFGDLNFKVSSKLDPKNLLSWSVYNSNDLLNFENSFQLQYPGDSLVNNSNLGFLKWGNFGTSVRFSRLWDESNYTDMFISYSKYGSEFSEKSTQQIIENRELVETQSSDAIQDNGIQDISFNVEHEWSGKNFTFVAGLQNSLYKTYINSTTNGEPVTQKDQDNVLLLTQFVHVDLPLSPAFDINFGLRSNYLSSREKVYLEPRASLGYQINDHLRLAAAGGIYTQFVNQINTQNVLQGSRDLWTLADNEIPVQISEHLIAGMAYSRSSLSFEFNFFQKQFSGIMDYAFRFGNRITEYENYEEQFFEGDGRAKGIETFIKHESSKFTGWLGYTLSKVNYRFDDIDEGDWFSADHDQRHEVNLFGSYRLGPLKLQATWFLGSGRPFTVYRLNARRNNNRRGNRPGVAILEADERNGRRLDTYHRLDLGLSYIHQLGNAELQVNANLFNVYDQNNIYDSTLETVVNPNLPAPGDGPGDGGPGDGGPGDGGPGDGGPGDGGPGGDGPGAGPMPTLVVPKKYGLMGFTPSISIELRF